MKNVNGTSSRKAKTIIEIDRLIMNLRNACNQCRIHGGLSLVDLNRALEQALQVKAQLLETEESTLDWEEITLVVTFLLEMAKAIYPLFICNRILGKIYAHWIFNKNNSDCPGYISGGYGLTIKCEQNLLVSGGKWKKAA